MFLLPDDTWQIKNTPKKGRGVFATKDIPAGTLIGDYLGKIISTAEEENYEAQYGLYLMYYHNRATIFPDVDKAGIHLINHSCTPNCWMYTYKRHTLYFALRHIFAGEELTVSYLLGPDASCDPCPHVCHCSSKHCTHTMHAEKKFFDEWDKFNTEITKQTKRQKVSYGHDLPKLDTYPEIISDAPIYPIFASTEKPSVVLNNSALFPIEKLREMMRNTGRMLEFPKLQKRIYGVVGDDIFSEPI